MNKRTLFAFALALVIVGCSYASTVTIIYPTPVEGLPSHLANTTTAHDTANTNATLASHASSLATLSADVVTRAGINGSTTQNFNAKEFVASTIVASGPSAGVTTTDRDDTTNSFMLYANSGVLYLYRGGNLGNWNGSTGNYTATSDRAKKMDIKPLTIGLREVMRMRPKAYRMKSSGTPSLGLIAQDLKPLVPEAVSGSEGKMGIAYDVLIPVLVRAIQEQQKQIDALRKKIR